MRTAYLTAGIPSHSAALYREIRFGAPDPAALIEITERIESPEAKRSFAAARPDFDRRESTRLLILRDIENERAIQNAAVDFVAAPVDFTPNGGLSGDRETATAQSTAEALRRLGAERVIADRSLPFLFAAMVGAAGLSIECDPERGVRERRSKCAEEITAIRESQRVTEKIMETVCRRIAAADTDSDGQLFFEGELLTSERVRAMIDHALLDFGFVNTPSIVAGGKDGGDCHAEGNGPLRTGEPIIVDIFPMSQKTRYFGDCTRTVVHGTIAPIYQEMLEAVRAAKAAATETIRPGVTGEEVHRATIAALERAGFGYAQPGSDEAERFPRLTHGTGHGLGLACHEPPLLDFGGPELIVGDVVSIEPGLYSKTLGGIRVEDMVTVTPDGCENLGQPLPETLNWRFTADI